MRNAEDVLNLKSRRFHERLEILMIQEIMQNKKTCIIREVNLTEERSRKINSKWTIPSERKQRIRQPV